MNKVIILDHNGGRLCNQLWNYISIYAYCLEKGYTCQNYSFYKYDQYFEIKDKDIFYKFLLLLDRITYAIRKNRFFHRFYKMYVESVENNPNSVVIDSGNDCLRSGVSYLPPTHTNRGDDLEVIKKNSKVYFKGWLCRNPIGIEKYRKEILESFRPKKEIRDEVNGFITPLREAYKNIVGIHIRQGDYRRGYLGGTLYFNEAQIAEFLRQYMAVMSKDPAQTCFIICSDEAVDLEPFKDLNIKLSLGGVMEDLHALSLTDTIIGSDSTFGAYASYYGNIPFIVFKEKIDWAYYKDKYKYFENSSCTQVCY